ncbi:MAG TPA: ATP-binding protein [Ideonella sp.]|nr:ATP-binding protein [Ideonella sp.]
MRSKMAALLLAASLFPLSIAGAIDIARARTQLLADVAADLASRSEELAHELDAVNRGYRRAADVLARNPAVLGFCAMPPGAAAVDKAALQAVLAAYPASDAGLRGVAILDAEGVVRAASEAALVGVDISARRYVQQGLRRGFVISEVHMAEPQVGEEPSIAYASPVLAADGEVLGLAVVWVRASGLWALFKEKNTLLGAGSFALLTDNLGIRMANSGRQDSVFHPTGTLPPDVVETLVAERRFGSRTRELASAAKGIPEVFEQARAAAISPVMFRTHTAVTGQAVYGVGRRPDTARWTVFYMVTGTAVDARTQQLVRQRLVVAAIFIAVALAAGGWVAAVILKPVASLSLATAALASGQLSARAVARGADELGRLGAGFNAMADRIETQALALAAARDDLELRVQQRTAELQQATEHLQAEVAERQHAQGRLQAQLERLRLLDQITSAIGERQDLPSIYQVVIRTLEDQLPLDFACVCRYDPVAHGLTVLSVGAGSRALALDLAMTERSLIRIDEDGLSKCVRGLLVYEPDLGSSAYPFPRRLMGGGLHGLVMAPLQAEGQVFGILVAARREPHSFSSGECEFLRQLSEHVALAAQQAHLHGALQQAYDDLRQSQQAVMQQERLRALGQMASGIAHDINNAISPIALYTESLLEREPGLSERTREYLQHIERAIADVAATVARMREFYRQKELQLALAPVQLNTLAQQVLELTRARWSDMPQQRGIVIESRLQADPHLPVVMGIESEIREALINLVFNAVDAMADGGTLTVSTRVVHEAGAGGSAPVELACIEVSDTGAGMDEATRGRCLEPFFTTKGERGTGLGLAMVYGIAQRHGAEIGIDSEPGRGTTVRLLFAVPPAAPVGAPGALPAGPAVALPCQRILVVDDDPLLLKSLQDALEGEGHSVVTANAGQAGIDAFRAALGQAGGFGVVITDLGMPYVDGRKVAAAVKQAAPATPVILLTGWGQRMATEGDVPAHVDRVLSKPPKLRDLREALSKLCQPDGETI